MPSCTHYLQWRGEDDKDVSHLHQMRESCVNRGHLRCETCTSRWLAEEENCVTCLQCQRSFCLKHKHAQEHLLMEDHTFALSTALGEIYCFACGDFSYGDDTDLRQSEATNTTLDCKILRKRRRLRGMELNLQPPSPDANTRSKAAKGIRLDPRRRALVAQGLFGGHIRSFCKSVEKQRLELKRSILFASGNDNEVDEIASLQGGEFSCIACEFDELFMDWYGKEPWDLTESDIVPRAPFSFLSTVWKIAETLAGYKQQDAHEFFIAVLDNLHAHLERHEKMKMQVKVFELALAEHEVEQKKAIQKLKQHQRKNSKLGNKKGSRDSPLLNIHDQQQQQLEIGGSEVINKQHCNNSAGGGGGGGGGEVDHRAVGGGSGGASQDGMCDSVHLLLPFHQIPSSPQSLSKSQMNIEDSVSLPTTPKLQGNVVTTLQGVIQDGWEQTSKSPMTRSSSQLSDLRLTDIVSEIFAGVTKSAVVCCKCDMTSCTYERFLEVSLSICSNDKSIPEGSSPNGKKGKSNNNYNKCPNGQQEDERVELSSCFQYFTAVEQLSSSMSCDGCGETSVSKTRELSFCYLPAVLTLQLKRFHANGRQKLNDHVKFPLYNLNMGNFMSRSSCHHNNGRKKDTSPPPTVLYDLLGVVSHKGNGGSGHYITYIRETGGWCKCDDMLVQWVDEEDVRNAEAYMLVYVAVEDNRYNRHT